MSEVKCYGNAQPGDLHCAADIVAIDGEIVEWLERQRPLYPFGNYQRDLAPDYFPFYCKREQTNNE
jgi:hypothetical protein